MEDTRPYSAPTRATSKSTTSLPTIAFQFQQFRNSSAIHTKKLPPTTYVRCCCGYDWCKARISQKVASRYRRSCEALQMMFETKTALDGAHFERKRIINSLRALKLKCEAARKDRNSRIELMEEAQKRVKQTEILRDVAKLNAEKWTTDRKKIKKQIKGTEQGMQNNLENMARLEPKYAVHKEVMTSQSFFIENYHLEIEEFKQALEQWDEKATTFVQEAIELKKKADDAQAKWNRAKTNYDEAEEQHNKFFGMYKAEEAEYDKGKSLVEGWRKQHPRLAKADVERHQDQLLLLGHDVEENRNAASSADADLHRTQAHMKQVQNELSELDVYMSAYKEDLAYWGGLLTETEHLRLMPDASPPAMSVAQRMEAPSVSHTLQETKERVSCPYCHISLECMPFMTHSSALLRTFFERPQEYIVITYRPPPLTEQEATEKDATGNKSNNDTMQGERATTTTKSNRVKFIRVCPELFQHWLHHWPTPKTETNQAIEAAQDSCCGCDVVRVARHEGQWRLFGLSTTEDIEVQEPPYLRLHPMTQTTMWKHRHGLPYRRAVLKKSFDGWKCGHCLELNLPDRTLCKGCGKARISKVELDAKKEELEREKREAQERARMLASETPQERMKREAKERKLAREKKKQRALEKQQGKAKRKQKHKAKTQNVPSSCLLARWSDFVKQQKDQRQKCKETEAARLLEYSMQMEKANQRNLTHQGFNQRD